MAPTRFIISLVDRAHANNVTGDAQMRETFELFAKLLSERLIAKVAMTEDSIRYTFFYALLSSGAFNHTEVIIEQQHPVIKKRQIDFVISPRDDRPSIAFEFKYDRTIPSKRNLNKTNRAGMVFNDLIRLAYIPEATAARKYFVYVTDLQMASYFKNPNNGIAGLFDLAMGQSFQVDTTFVNTRPPSFRTKISCDPIAFDVVGYLACDLGEEHFLRVYEIKAG
jgi:hypothetical protein